MTGHGYRYEVRLEAKLLPRAPSSAPFVEPDWARVHRELDRKGRGVTLMLLWQEYVEAHPGQRTTDLPRQVLELLGVPPSTYRVTA